jgi:cellulose synthase (UDP-forming)
MMHVSAKSVASNKPQEPLLGPIFTGYRKIEFLAGVAIWTAALAYFWAWWLRPEHHFNMPSSVMVGSRPISLRMR